MIKKYALLFLALPLFAQSQTIEFESTVAADLNGYAGATTFSGLGEYEIFLDTESGVLDKPIILLDGFDPADGRDITGIYDLLDYTGSGGDQNLADLVRAEGFDVVILNFPVYFRLSDNTLLNFDDATDVNADTVIDEADYPGSTLVDGGVDFIERNAMLLVDLINTLNADKVGDEELVIIGPSMGGLISRYALNYMEHEQANNGGPDHETRLWMSFDAPHLGANIPLGFQHQFNYLANGLGDGVNIEELQPVVNGLLKSPAARQLLVDHFETHLENGSLFLFDATKVLPEAHPYRTTFDTNINNLSPTGYPQNTRNVAIINGSGIGTPFQDINGAPVTPGFSVLNIVDLSLPDIPPASNITATLQINLTPTSGNQEVISKILVTGTVVIFPFTVADAEVESLAPAFSDGVDAASGGLFNLSAFTEGLDTEGLVGSVLTELQLNKFSYIPSVSGMALDVAPANEVNWFHDIDLGEPDSTGDTLNSTPFVNWHMPDDNEDHVQLTEENVIFALSEIIPETLSNTDFENLVSIKVEKNPIVNELTILSNKTLDDANISLIDITGKSVYRSTQTLDGRLSIPLNLDSGMYILNLETKDNYNYRTKIIVR
ncbi:T9SS type A sorting domain-containing protein [Psychroserpens sp. SPM9]|uniref:T9SS type A sorting domain-containing protein n=1 Tax=Psychroserpens sp. SPM9 TaxID=2975598 RepID=UPI0021A36773|nr:T9SS type A sorting domain-containing protein [Psychroserpens sp. SPM9]MDG5492856.1 T9SS type A sorting domain-containing protein [Psychroserpens sp. SPM9]